MRFVLWLCVPVLFSIAVNAQDTLFIKNRVPVTVKILSAENETIRYKRFDNLKGPDYVIRSRSVEKIVYESGEIRTSFEPVKVKEEKPPKPPRNYKWHTGKTYFQFVASDLLFGLITVEPERSFFDGRLSLCGTFSYGLIHAGYMDTLINMDNPDFIPQRVKPKTLGHYGNGKKFSAGGTIYFIPAPTKKVRYAAGLGASYGEFSYRTSVYTFNPDKPLVYLDADGYYYSIVIRNGLWAQLTSLVHVSLTAGTGFNLTYSPRYDSGYNAPPKHSQETNRAFELGLAVGLRF